MKLALIYERGSRGGVGERYQAVLGRDPSLEISRFNIDEIQTAPPDFDLYLRLDGNYERTLPSNMHPYAWWVTDTHLKSPLRLILKTACRADHVFCAHREGAELLEHRFKRPVFWLPTAADPIPSDFSFKNDAEKKWDICFIGTTGKFSLRKVALELIREHYPNSFVGRAPYTELRAYYSLSRIVVNYPINNDINMRVFEAMSAGALLFNRSLRGNGFPEMFKPGKHLVTFDDVTTDELKQKIDYYLSHTAEREAIARAGFDLVRQKHTYAHRFKEMFSRMGFSFNARV